MGRNKKNKQTFKTWANSYLASNEKLWSIEKKLKSNWSESWGRRWGGGGGVVPRTLHGLWILKSLRNMVLLH